MKTMQKYLVGVIVLLGVFLLGYGVPSSQATTPTKIVCAVDSVNTSHCDSVADGVDDQVEINLALAGLPATGGEVILSDGHFFIGRAGIYHGGIVITRSGTHLRGSGLGTKLTLLDGLLDVNVIQVAGDEISNIVISDLWVDANRIGQQIPTYNTFQSNGIKVSSLDSHFGNSNANNITIRNVLVEECATLCVVLKGRGLFIKDSWFGNATDDVVEILQGPGAIQNNYFEISGFSGTAISTDAANDVSISDNVIYVLGTGSLTNGIRTWSGFYRNNVQDNIIKMHVDDGRWGMLETALRIGTSRSLVSGNIVMGAFPIGRPIMTKVIISAGPNLVSGNYFEHVLIEIDDTTTNFGAVTVANNILVESRVSLASER